MSKLDISGRGKASSDNGESVDGEFQSTTTTPLNYMRRTTPTAAPNRRPEAIQEKSYSEESSDLDMDKAFRNIHLTTTSQDFNFNPNIQQQNNNADQEIGNEGGNFGDAGSEATVEPWNYVQSSAMDPARNFSSAGPGGRPSGDNSNIMLGRGGGSFEYPHSLNSFGELSLESVSAHSQTICTCWLPCI